MQNSIDKLFSVEWKAHWIAHLQSCFPNTNGITQPIDFTKLKYFNVYWQNGCEMKNARIQIDIRNTHRYLNVKRSISIDGVMNWKNVNTFDNHRKIHGCTSIEIRFFHARFPEYIYIQWHNGDDIWIQHCYAKLILVIIHDDYWKNQQTKNKNAFTNIELIIYNDYLLQIIAKY